MLACRTPLHYAAAFGHSRIAKRLLGASSAPCHVSAQPLQPVLTQYPWSAEAGADVRAWSKDNQTAADVAEDPALASLLETYAKKQDDDAGLAPSGPSTPRRDGSRSSQAPMSEAAMTTRLQQSAAQAARQRRT